MNTSRTPSATRIPAELDLHLAAHGSGEITSTSAYLDRGGELVDAAAIAGLRSLQAPLAAKIRGLELNSRLRRRLEILAAYFNEARPRTGAGDVAYREVTFALLYFLKGFDRIPDTVPEVGLLDDAMIAQFVFERHSASLRAHALRRGRAWPVDL
ncbi:MAG: hypothetical protein RLZZ188_1766 [Verrucomicrobiota bacterium]|jgi:uncharacterized membrane protein YkvA (DUF1232 family)